MARWKKEGAEFKPLAVGPPGPPGPEGPQGPQGEPGDSHVPDPAQEPDGYELKVQDGQVIYSPPSFSVVGSSTAPVTDENVARPESSFVLWITEVQPVNAADVDLVIIID